MADTDQSRWNGGRDNPAYAMTEDTATLSDRGDGHHEQYQHQQGKPLDAGSPAEGLDAGTLKPKGRDRPAVSTSGIAAGVPGSSATGHKPAEKEERVMIEAYTMYKTESRIYIIASNRAESLQADSRFRVLKIDRHYSATDASHDLGVTEDDMIYSKSEIENLIEMIGEGNKMTGGCQLVVPLFYGILGFVRFTAGWYIIVVKQRAAVALIGGHYIYHCEEAMTIPISNNAKPEKPSEENRLYNAFHAVDLSKNFYFSHTYDLTNTLQNNLTGPIDGTGSPSMKDSQVHYKADHAFHEPSSTLQSQSKTAWGFNDKFIWNHFLLRAAFQDRMDAGRDTTGWVLPIIYGYVDQAKVSIYGRTVYVTLIARRSRFFAGARFMKRGVNDEGNVANDVETEQIVSEGLTTSFSQPSGRYYDGRKATARYTSFVQHRGSIPLSWQQEVTPATMKPPIHLHLVDPYHSAAALHFDDLIGRYGSPIMILNLVKAKEGTPRESKLLQPFVECIDYLNQFLPDTDKIQYEAFDMSATKKNVKLDLVSMMEDIAQNIVRTTKFFHSGAEPVGLSMQTLKSMEEGNEPPQRRTTPLLQKGAARTNCIDCLDRTNAAQFMIAKAAFGHQLHALGVLAKPVVEHDNDAVDMLTEMYHDHGDTIALQYGGSHLVNTMNTYRKINHWSSHSRDMIENVKRYYSNVALDQDKQNSINLFLGIDAGDNILSATNPAAALANKVMPLVNAAKHRAVERNTVQSANPSEVEKVADKASIDEKEDHVPHVEIARRDYRQWYSPENIGRRTDMEQVQRHMQESICEDGDYWLEYYRPRLFTGMDRLHAFKVNSTTRYHKPRPTDLDLDLDPEEEEAERIRWLSPFTHRPVVEGQGPKSDLQRIGGGMRRWMSVQKKPRVPSPSNPMKMPKPDENELSSEDEALLPPANTTEGLALRLMNPKVHHAEASEYTSYVHQFRNLNLSNELSYESSAIDLRMYENAVRLAKDGGVDRNLFRIDRATEEIYEKAVHLSSERKYLRAQARYTDTSSEFSA